jgi:hypothetical protein
MITHTRRVLLLVLALGIVYSGFQLPGLRPVQADAESCFCVPDDPGHEYCETYHDPDAMCNDDRPCTVQYYCQESEAMCSARCGIPIIE